MNNIGVSIWNRLLNIGVTIKNAQLRFKSGSLNMNPISDRMRPEQECPLNSHPWNHLEPISDRNLSQETKANAMPQHRGILINWSTIHMLAR